MSNKTDSGVFKTFLSNVSYNLNLLRRIMVDGARGWGWGGRETGFGLTSVLLAS